MNRIVNLIVLFYLLNLSIISHAYAFPGFNKKQNANKAAKQEDVLVNPEILNLVNTLSLHPELMHLDYLQYYIGRPENESVHRVNLHKHFYWYQNDSSHSLAFEMDQLLQAPFQVTKSTFTAYILNSKLTLKDAKKLLGNDYTQFYDSKGIPCTSYSTSPFTTLIFKEPSNAFRITKIAVDYQGPPLPGPSLQYIGYAQDYRFQKLLKNLDNGNPQDLIAMLQNHLREFPSDPKAHLELAKVYQKTFNINEAIKEYQMSINCANNNPEIINEADAGLRTLKVLPPQ